MREFRKLMVATVLICVLPIISVLLSTAIASLGGCKLDEASVHPCVVAGVDIGEALGVMFITGWFAIATLPVLGISAFVWAGVELGRILVDRLNRR